MKSHPRLPLHLERAACYIADGLTDKEIATRMAITEGSLAQYLNRIYELLDLREWGNSRVRLARWVWDRLADRTPTAAGSD